MKLFASTRLANEKAEVENNIAAIRFTSFRECRRQANGIYDLDMHTLTHFLLGFLRIKK